MINLSWFLQDFLDFSIKVPHQGTVSVSVSGKPGCLVTHFPSSTLFTVLSTVTHITRGQVISITDNLVRKIELLGTHINTPTYPLLGIEEVALCLPKIHI